ncbi:MAG: PepSY domain-containing protein, partial [Halobacteriales archaeon]
MDLTKILAAGLVVVLAAGGVVASGGVGSPVANDDTSALANSASNTTNADVHATQENGTVTLTLVDEGDGVANATVDVEREHQREYDDQKSEDEYDRVGTTDANGTVVFALSSENESRNVTSLEVEFTKGQFNAELEYNVENGSLSLIEEEYEYEEENEDEEHDSIAASNVSLSEENATNVATAEVNGSVDKVELESEDGTPIYEVELVTENGSETEVVIHANDGTVLETQNEQENEDEEHDSIAASNVSLSE